MPRISIGGTIVTSLVNDIIMPPIGLLLGRVDFVNLFATIKSGDPARPYATLADAQAEGAVAISYGVFINTVITLILMAAIPLTMIGIMPGFWFLNLLGERTIDGFEALRVGPRKVARGL